MNYGKVVYFDDVKGLGLIDDGENPENIQVHYKDIAGSGFKSLAVGDRVTFRFDKAGGKLRARDVEVVRPAKDLSRVEQLFDIRLSQVPRQVKDSLVETLPEEQKTLVNEVIAELDPSIEQTIERVGLGRKKFEALDGLAAQTLSNTYVNLVKGSRKGGFGGSFGSSGL